MGTLYIVGTPIGNLGDFSPRAIEILKTVDFIAAEDTRVTLKLLNHFEIRNTHQLPRTQCRRPRPGAVRTPAERRKWGHCDRCGDALHQRPRRGAGGALPRKRSGNRHGTRSYRCYDRSGR